MATEKQIAANRANARKSTGPRTAKGKAASARNALKHGLSARILLTADEDPEEFQNFSRALREDLDPQNPVEEALVQLIIQSAWRMRRGPRHEARMCGNFLESVTNEAQFYDHIQRLFDNGEYSRLVRYELAAENKFHRAMRALICLRKRKTARLPFQCFGVAAPASNKAP